MYRVSPRFVLTSLLQYLSKNSHVARSSSQMRTSAAQSQNQISLAPSQSRTTSIFSLISSPVMRRREIRLRASLPRSPREAMHARCVWLSHSPDIHIESYLMLFSSFLSLLRVAVADESTLRDAPARVPQLPPMEVEDPTLDPQVDRLTPWAYRLLLAPPRCTAEPR